MYQEDAFNTVEEEEVVKAQEAACHQVFHSFKSKVQNVFANLGHSLS